MSEHLSQSNEKSAINTTSNKKGMTDIDENLVLNSENMSHFIANNGDAPIDPNTMLAMQSTFGNQSMLQTVRQKNSQAKILTGQSANHHSFSRLKMLQRLHPLEDPSNIASTDPSAPKPEQDLDTDGKLTPVYAQAWEVAWSEFKPKVEDISKQLPGSKSSIAPLKGRERAKEKSTTDYGGDTAGLVDIARGSIVCASAQQVIDAWELVNSTFTVVRVKNRFANPSDGYRDLMINVELSNNHVAELQLHLAAIIKAKEAGHKFYETARTIEAKPETERSEQEKKDLAEAKEAMKQLYDAAWEEAKSIPEK